MEEYTCCHERVCCFYRSLLGEKQKDWLIVAALNRFFYFGSGRFMKDRQQALQQRKISTLFKVDPVEPGSGHVLCGLVDLKYNWVTAFLVTSFAV